MIRKVVLILTLMIVVLLAVTNVGAADNLTDEIVSVEDEDMEIPITLDNAEINASDLKSNDESDCENILAKDNNDSLNVYGDGGSSVIFDEGSYVDGGMNFRYTLKDKNGNSVSHGDIFAEFGKNTLSVYNKWTKETVTKTVFVKERILESNDVTIEYKDTIEYKVRAANNEDNFTSGLSVKFIIDGWDTFYETTDNEGYATLKTHLSEGTYHITIKYCGVVHDRTVIVKPSYVYDKYKDVHVTSVTAQYGADKEISIQWKGYFKGYLQIYKGNKLVHKSILDSSGYVGDYIKYKLYGDEFPTATLLSVGTYKVEVVSLDGKTLAQSTIKIVKTPTKVKISSIKGKPRAKKYVTATVYDKSDGLKHWGGKVTFKINGKTYKVKVKKGVAKLKIKLPSKEKTYNCKATFSGDKNSKSKTVKFKITVKSSSITKKTTTKKNKSKSFTVTVPAKLNKKISRSHGKYKVTTYKWIDYNSNGKKDAHLRISIYKNGKKLTGFDAKYWVHYKTGGGVWLYTKNAGGGYKSNPIGYNNVLKTDKVTATIWP
ncbi:MAG: hypothetical protein VZR10_07325 [Methanobrevibacter sp.]|nr:hypothetical protein [Methanobrevibacter sp.]